jgi:hypothetical protein
LKKHLEVSPEMNCARCGTANDPGMNFCINCGNPLMQQPPPPPSSFEQPSPYSWQTPSYEQPPQQPPAYSQPPAAYGQRPPLNQPNLFGAYTQDVPNYLVPAILSTIFCCVPAGIVAIVYAAQVNSRKQVGDVAGAMDASGKAQTWCWVSFGLGLIVIILNVIIAVSDIK